MAKEEMTAGLSLEEISRKAAEKANRAMEELNELHERMTGISGELSDLANDMAYIHDYAVNEVNPTQETLAEHFNVTPEELDTVGRTAEELDQENANVTAVLEETLQPNGQPVTEAVSDPVRAVGDLSETAQLDWSAGLNTNLTSYGYTYQESLGLTNAFANGDDPVAYLRDNLGWQNISYVMLPEDATGVDSMDITALSESEYPGMTKMGTLVPGSNVMIVGYDTSENVFERQMNNPDYLAGNGVFADNVYSENYYDMAHDTYEKSMQKYDSYFSSHPGEYDYVVNGLPDGYEPVVTDAPAAAPTEDAASVFEAEEDVLPAAQTEVVDEPVEIINEDALQAAQNSTAYYVEGPTMAWYDDEPIFTENPPGYNEIMSRGNDYMTYLENQRLLDPERYEDFPQKLYFCGDEDTPIPQIPGMTVITGKIEDVPGYYYGYESYNTTYNKATDAYTEAMAELDARQAGDTPLSAEEYTEAYSSIESEYQTAGEQFATQQAEYHNFNSQYNGSYLYSDDPLKAYGEKTIGYNTSIGKPDYTEIPRFSSAEEIAELEGEEVAKNPDWLAKLSELLKSLGEKISNWYQVKVLGTSEEDLAATSEESKDKPAETQEETSEPEATEESKAEPAKESTQAENTAENATPAASAETAAPDAPQGEIPSPPQQYGYANKPIHPMGLRPITNKATDLVFGRGQGSALPNFNTLSINTPDFVQKQAPAPIDGFEPSVPEADKQHRIPEMIPAMPQAESEKSAGKESWSKATRARSDEFLSKFSGMDKGEAGISGPELA